MCPPCVQGHRTQIDTFQTNNISWLNDILETNDWEIWYKTFNLGILITIWKVLIDEIKIDRSGNFPTPFFVVSQKTPNWMRLYSKANDFWDSEIPLKAYSPRYIFCIFFLDCWFKRKRYQVCFDLIYETLFYRPNFFGNYSYNRLSAWLTPSLAGTRHYIVE